MSTESTKTFKGRISNKHGTEEYWILSVYNSTTDLTDSNKRTNPFIPLPGELIIYDPDVLHPYYRFKFGDNEEDETKRKNVVELPFVLSDYLFEIDYDALLAFDTSEIVIGATTTSVLGQAILGQMVLA